MKGLRKLKDDGSLLSAKLPETILERLRKQKLGAINDGYWLDEVGDYHGIQHEKSVYDFDGVNGHVVFDKILEGTIDNFDISFVMKGGNTQGTILGQYLFAGNNGSFLMFSVSSNFRTFLTSDGSTNYIQSYNSSQMFTNTWTAFRWVYDGALGISNLYQNGILLTPTSAVGTFPTTLYDGNSNLVVGRTEGINGYFRDMQFSDLVVKSDGNTLLNMKCEEQTGTIAFDSSGNENNGTFSGGVTHTNARSLLLVNHANESGYSDGTGGNDGAIIPRDESDITKDVLGNNLQFVGRVASDMKFVESNCIYLSGSNQYGLTVDKGQDDLINEIEFYINLGSDVTASSPGRFALGFYNGTSTFGSGIIFGAFTGAITGETLLIDSGTAKVAITETIPAGTHHYKISWNATQYDIFIDGIQRTTTTSGTPSKINARQIWVGCRQNLSLFLVGKVFGLKITTGAGVIEYPIAEGFGTTSYAKEDQTKTITWNGGATWTTQDEYHHNITQGFTANVNHLPFSDTQVFGNSSVNNWTKSGSQVITNNNLDAFGTNTAFSSTLNVSDSHFDIYRRVEGLTANVEYTFSLYVKLGTATDLAVTVNTTLAWNTLPYNRLYTAADGLNTSTFTRIDYNFTPITSRVHIHIGKNAQTNPTAPQSTGTVFFCFAQIELGRLSSPYQKTEASPTVGVKLPYKIGGKFTNPPCEGLNGAETRLRQSVFREDLSNSSFHFNKSLESNTIDFNTVLNTSEVFVEENENSKTNVETFLPSGIVTIVNRKENDIYNNKNT
jgi:hypothetical protein